MADRIIHRILGWLVARRMKKLVRMVDAQIARDRRAGMVLVKGGKG